MADPINSGTMKKSLIFIGDVSAKAVRFTASFNLMFLLFSYLKIQMPGKYVKYLSLATFALVGSIHAVIHRTMKGRYPVKHLIEFMDGSAFSAGSMMALYRWGAKSEEINLIYFFVALFLSLLLGVRRGYYTYSIIRGESNFVKRINRIPPSKLTKITLKILDLFLVIFRGFGVTYLSADILYLYGVSSLRTSDTLPFSTQVAVGAISGFQNVVSLVYPMKYRGALYGCLLVFLSGVISSLGALYEVYHPERLKRPVHELYSLFAFSLSIASGLYYVSCSLRILRYRRAVGNPNTILPSLSLTASDDGDHRPSSSETLESSYFSDDFSSQGDRASVLLNVNNVAASSQNSFFESSFSQLGNYIKRIVSQGGNSSCENGNNSPIETPLNQSISSLK